MSHTVLVRIMGDATGQCTGGQTTGDERGRLGIKLQALVFPYVPHRQQDFYGDGVVIDFAHVHDFLRPCGILFAPKRHDANVLPHVWMHPARRDSSKSSKRIEEFRVRKRGWQTGDDAWGGRRGWPSGWRSSRGWNRIEMKNDLRKCMNHWAPIESGKSLLGCTDENPGEKNKNKEKCRERGKPTALVESKADTDLVQWS